MIAFLRKAIQNGDVRVIDNVKTDYNIHYVSPTEYVREKTVVHNIILKDTRTDEKVQVAVIIEGEEREDKQ